MLPGKQFGEGNGSGNPSKMDIEFDCRGQRPYDGWRKPVWTPNWSQKPLQSQALKMGNTQGFSKELEIREHNQTKLLQGLLGPPFRAQKLSTNAFTR